MLKTTTFGALAGLLVSLAPVAAQDTPSQSDAPGSVLVFPKFETGSYVAGYRLDEFGRPDPRHPILEPRSTFEISVTCPDGERCPEGAVVKLLAEWVCPGSAVGLTKFIVQADDFEILTTVRGTVSFDPENLDPSGTFVPTPPCEQGYLLVWVVSPTDVDAPRAIKFDGLVGKATLRASERAAGAYNAHAIQAAPAIASGAPTDQDGDRALDFDGSEYREVSGQLIGTVEYERLAPTRTEPRLETRLTLLTLAVNANRSNYPTFVDLRFYNERGVLFSTGHELIGWSSMKLRRFDRNLTAPLFGRKGLVEVGPAEKIPIPGVTDTAGPVPILGLIETVEGRTLRESVSPLGGKGPGVDAAFKPN
jgi:hypothetical protein